jgi:hypothetical protein
VFQATQAPKDIDCGHKGDWQLADPRKHVAFQATQNAIAVRISPPRRQMFVPLARDRLKGLLLAHQLPFAFLTKLRWIET